MRAQLDDLVGESPAAFTDIRLQRRWRTVVVARNRQILHTTLAEDLSGVIRCLNPGHGWGLASFETVEQARSALRTAHEFSLATPLHPSITLSALPARQATIPCPDGRDPRDVPLSRKRELVEQAMAALFAVDRRVVDVRLKWEDAVSETSSVNSEGMSLCETRPLITMGTRVLAEETGTVERALDSCSTPGALDDVEEWVAGIASVAARAVASLHAVPVRPGRFPVVLDPRLAGLLTHRVLAHRCAAGAGLRLLPLGTRIGPELLTVGDDGRTSGLRGTAAFDWEGVQTQHTTLVRNGVVVGHLHTRASAGAAGLASTGNARAGGSAFPTARPTNTYVAKGQGGLADLLRPIQLGVYLARPESARDDGQVTLRAGLGRMIRRGELAEPVKGATLQGDPLGLFGMVEAIGGDFTWDPAAAQCDLRGDPVEVGAGAPHVRLVEAQVGEQV